MIPLTIALLILFVVFVVATVMTEMENFGWATVTLIATVVGLQFFHVVDVLHYVMHHALETLLYVAGYLVVGIVWSFIKWFSFLMQFRDKYREAKDDFCKDNGLKPEAIPENMEKQLRDYVSRRSYSHEFRGNVMGDKPRAANNKSRIVSWMSLWPFSIIGTLLNDPIKRLFKLLFNTFKNLYQKMADRVFANDPELK